MDAARLLHLTTLCMHACTPAWLAARRMRKLAANEKMLAALCTPVLARHMLKENKRQKAKLQDAGRGGGGGGGGSSGGPAPAGGVARRFRKAYAKSRMSVVLNVIKQRLLCADEDAYSGYPTDQPLDTPVQSERGVRCPSGMQCEYSIRLLTPPSPPPPTHTAPKLCILDARVSSLQLPEMQALKVVCA